MDRRVQSAPRARGGLVAFVARRPRSVGLLALWAFGLFAVFLAPAPVKTTPARVAAFQAQLAKAQAVQADVDVAQRRLMEAEFDTRASKVWFWRFRESARAEVAAKRPALDAARARAAELRAARDARLRAARAELGLWSEAGLEEGRELFWTQVQAGKVFAQRQTVWDAVFTALSSRDSDWLGVLLQVLLAAVANFTVGMLVSVFLFVVSLPGWLWSWAPSVWSGAVFFAVATVGAASVVASYLTLLYAAGAVSLYSIASLAANRRRLGGPGPPTRPPALVRPHAE